MEQAKVTIGVRCYNAAKYIERCARSLFEQTYTNCDFLFVDDCSKDNTVEKIKEIASEYPEREAQVRIIIREENGNRACCLNTVLDNIEGEFFTLVDSDDYLTNEAIEELCKAQSNANADMVLCEMQHLFGDHSTIYGLSDFTSGKDLCVAQLGFNARWCICGALIRSILLTPDIRCIPGANMGEDFAIEVRLSYKAEKICILHKSLYIYDRTNEDSSMFTFNESFRRQFDENMDMLYSFFADKGSMYLDAWNHTRIKSLIEDVKLVCKAGGHNRFYDDRVKRIKAIDKGYKKFYPLTYRLIESLLCCRPVLNILLRYKS